MPDPRILTGIALLVVGISATVLAMRIWWTHPINRVFSIGPFVTEKGLKALLRHSGTIYALGVFAIVSALSRLAFVGLRYGWVAPRLAYLMGLFEALFATWAALAVAVTAWRLWRGE